VYVQASITPSSVVGRPVRVLAVVTLTGTLVLGGTAGAAATRPGSPSCRPQRLGAGYSRRVRDAVLARSDVWGDALLRSARGPTYDRARADLKPLLLAGQPRRRPLTDSGVFYLAFGQPRGPGGRGPIALHVADGSEILSDRADGPKLTLTVGEERFGSCLARLATPKLYGGYYPILQTRYVDANGVRFEQESFAARVPEADSVVSFVRLTAEAPAGSPPEQVRFTPSDTGLAATDGRLARGSDTYLFFSDGGRFAGSSLVYPVGGGQSSTIYLARLVRHGPSRPIVLDEPGYEQARQALIAYWDGRLAQGAAFVVPDPRVLAAERNLLIQNLLMTWRYSLGNPYETFEFPESLENATVMGEYGFGDVERAIVETSLRREPHLYPNWEAGSRLLAAARYYRLYADRAFVTAATPTLRRNVALLQRHLRHGLLSREKYTADLPDVAYGLQAQAVAWQGLSAMARVWAATGRSELAGESRAAAARLRAGLRAAVAESAVGLPDGSLFLPARLLDGERPYETITESKHGGYWNLVIQDALASGLFAPHSREASGALAYMLEHGSRLLGLVRGGAYALYGTTGRQSAGTDEVYGLNVARFLADNDKPDQLVLSLYGALAAAMTEGTFVSGEGATVSPRPGEYYRAMYLPPNSTSNAAFLEYLRLMLVHETEAADGNPRGLELAHATPRAWLAPGKRIEVRDAPTSFGPVSFSIDSARRSVEVQLRIPSRARVGSLSLRLRRPGAQRIRRIDLDGRGFRRFDPATETIDLTGHTGRLTLTAYYDS